MPCALPIRSEEHTSELQSHDNLVCRLLLEKKKEQLQDLRRGRLPAARQRVHGGPRRRRRPPAARQAVHPGTRHRPEAVHPSFFFFNDTAPTEISTLSLHDALPICMIVLASEDIGTAPPQALGVARDAERQ